MFIRRHTVKDRLYYEVLISRRDAQGRPRHEFLGRWRHPASLGQAIQQAEENGDFKRVELLLNVRLRLAKAGIPEPDPAALLAGNTAADMPERSFGHPAAADQAPTVQPMPAQPLAREIPSINIVPSAAPAPLAPAVRFEPLLPKPAPAKLAPARHPHPPPPAESDTDLPPPTGDDFLSQLHALGKNLVFSVLSHAANGRVLYDIAAVTSTSLAKVRQVIAWLEQQGLVANLDRKTGRIRLIVSAASELQHRCYSNGKPSSWFTEFVKPQRVTLR